MAFPDQIESAESVSPQEAGLRRIVNLTPQMLAVIEPDGRISWLNEVALDYLGISSADLSTDDFPTRIIHPDDLHKYAEYWQSAIARGMPFEAEQRLRGKDGKYRWFLNRYKPLKDTDRRVVRWYAAITDIEDRRRAEDALRRSEAYLMEAQRLSKTGSWAYNPFTTETVYWSDEMFRIFGLDPREGPSSERFWQLVHPDDLDRVRSRVEREARDSKEYSDEYRIVLRDGTIKHVLEIGHPVFNDTRDVAEFVGTTVDVTEHKRAEAELRESEGRFRKLADTAPVMIWITDPDIRCTWFNQQWLDFTGRTMQEELGHGWVKGVHLEDSWRLQAGYSACDRREPFRLEYRIRRRDGEFRWVDDTGVPLFSADGGAFLGYIGSCVDITDRKRAEEALQRSEAYLAEAQKLTHTGSWVLDPVKEELLHCSEELFRVYGVDLQQSPPAIELLLDRVHPEDRERVRERRIKAIHDKVEHAMDYRLLLPDGTIKYIHSIRHPVVNEAGDIVQFVGTSMDVTEQKRAEEALRRSESYLTEAQKLTKTGTLVWDPVRAQTLYCSDEVFRMFGLDPQKGIPAIAELLERVHPQDLEYVTGRSRKGAEDKAGLVVDYRLLLPDGTLKYIHSIRHPILNDAEEVVEFLGTIIDVTEQKRSEETLRRSEAYLAEAQKLTHTGSWAYDPVTDKIVYWSEEMFRLFGLDPREGVPSGPKVGQLIHPEDHDRVHEQIQKSISEKADYEVEHRIVLPDGTVRHIETIGHPVLNANGEVIECVGTALDVTERKRAEQEREKLGQLEADLAHMNRVSMMGELAASLAHEIKQPIAAAATNANTCLLWLQREPSDIEEAREAASRIVKDVTRAADIIDRNRSLYIRDTPKRKTLNLNEIIREMIVLLRDKAHQHSVSIRIELDEALPAITADRVQMQQVLMNLMLNGIEAMKDSGGELTISSQKEDSQILLSVSDVGIGLPTEKTDQIFDAFFTTKALGTGMGLSISRRIIESHGGRLWACPQTGPGATFQFTLPIATCHL